MPEQVPLIKVEARPLSPPAAPRGGSATKPFRAWNPDQAAWLPASKRDYLGDAHLAVFLRDLLEHLNLRPILEAYTEDRGQPPYDPRMMTVLLLYAYSQGITSSRQIERRCREDLAFMYLTADAQPDHDTICAFRRQHLAAFQPLFLETLRVAQAAGVLKLGRIVLDGTKVRANASKHKAMSDARMPRAEIERLLTEAEAIDQAEDQRDGRGRRGDELPTELQDPTTRRQRLGEAKARLEAERKRELAAAKQAQLEKIESAQRALEAEAHAQAEAAGQRPEAARPDPQAQRNFTDPESRIMKTPDGFGQCYNAQVAVEERSQLIVAADVVTAPNDKQQLQPLVAQVISNVGVPRGVIADSRYFSEGNVLAVEEWEGVRLEAHIAVDRDRTGLHRPGLHGGGSRRG